MGNFIIPCEYDDISYLGDSLFSVRKNELVGVLNSQGETILPLECSAPYNNNIFRYKNAFIVHTDVRERIPLIIDGAISTWARLSVLTNCHGNIFYIFSTCLQPFLLHFIRFPTLRIFHVCLWLIMWSETLAALEFSVLKQHCSRPRKWSNLNQVALNRLLTQRKYQAINCTSVYNDKQIS